MREPDHNTPCAVCGTQKWDHGHSDERHGWTKDNVTDISEHHPAVAALHSIADAELAFIKLPLLDRLAWCRKHWDELINDTEYGPGVSMRLVGVLDDSMTACQLFKIMEPQMRKLLEVAVCPECDGSGGTQVAPDDWVQCQWCDERATLTSSQSDDE